MLDTIHHPAMLSPRRPCQRTAQSRGQMPLQSIGRPQRRGRNSQPARIGQNMTPLDSLMRAGLRDQLRSIHRARRRRLSTGRAEQKAIFSPLGLATASRDGPTWLPTGGMIKWLSLRLTGDDHARFLASLGPQFPFRGGGSGNPRQRRHMGSGGHRERQHAEFTTRPRNIAPA